MVSLAKQRLVVLELLAVVVVVLIASCGSTTTSGSGSGPEQEVTAVATAFGNAFWHAHYAKAMQYAVPKPNPLLIALANQDSPTAVTSDDAKVANVKVDGASATFDFIGTFCGATSSNQTVIVQGGASGGPGQPSNSWSSSTVVTGGSTPQRRCVTNSAASGDARFHFRAVKGADGAWRVEFGKPRRRPQRP